jgi:hypothetical protein
MKLLPPTAVVSPPPHLLPLAVDVDEIGNALGFGVGAVAALAGFVWVWVWLPPPTLPTCRSTGRC